MDSGQASLEYTALLALVGATLAAAAVAPVGEVAQAVAGGVRMGLCLVANDVCRASDAAAAGLEPCVVGDRRRGRGGTVTLVSLRFGEHGEWVLATRSDGSAIVTRTEQKTAGAGVGFALTASPLGVQLGARGEYGFTIGAGSAWVLPGPREAARFVASGRWMQAPPDWRFGDAGAELEADAGAGAGGALVTGVEATAAAAGGVRVGRGERTLYIATSLGAPEGFALFRGGDPESTDVVVELTRAGGELRELAFRRVEPGGPGRVVETVGRLDLRVPANRAAAEPLLSRRLPWPPGVVADAQAVVRRTVQAGTIERAVYAVTDGSRSFDASARFGVEVGLELDRMQVDRRLVAASAWTHGSRERERFDCLRRAT